MLVYFQWKDINPDQLMDYKLKCVFETPRGTNLNVRAPLHTLVLKGFSLIRPLFLKFPLIL